jgi:polar amino acid transport system substrate-binding protein
VTVASDYPFPPWEYLGSNGRLTGFDYDIGQAIGKVLGVNFRFEQQTFNGIIPGLQAGKYDLAISSITDNTARESVVTFVDYALSKGALLVVQGNPHHLGQPATWCGETLAIQAGTVATGNIAQANKICKTGKKPAIQIKTYPSSSSTQLAVSSGAAAANLNDGASLAYVQKAAGSGKTFTVVQYTAPWNSPALIGIAIPKTQPQLVKAVKAALQEIISTGVYRRIAAKYGMLPYTVKSAQVNGAAH